MSPQRIVMLVHVDADCRTRTGWLFADLRRVVADYIHDTDFSPVTRRLPARFHRRFQR